MADKEPGGHRESGWRSLSHLLPCFLFLELARCVTAQRAQARALRLIAPFITANNGDGESCLPIAAVWLLPSPQGCHRETTQGTSSPQQELRGTNSSCFRCRRRVVPSCHLSVTLYIALLNGQMRLQLRMNQPPVCSVRCDLQNVIIGAHVLPSPGSAME